MKQDHMTRSCKLYLNYLQYQKYDFWVHYGITDRSQLSTFSRVYKTYTFSYPPPSPQKVYEKMSIFSTDKNTCVFYLRQVTYSTRHGKTKAHPDTARPATVTRPTRYASDLLGPPGPPGLTWNNRGVFGWARKASWRGSWRTNRPDNVADRVERLCTFSRDAYMYCSSLSYKLVRLSPAVLKVCNSRVYVWRLRLHLHRRTSLLEAISEN